MLRKESEAFPEGNRPILPNTHVLPGITAEDFQRVWWKVWKEVCEENGLEKPGKAIEERTSIDQRLTRLEHGARQPRLAMEADGHANTKTQERTEGAAITVQAMRGYSFTTAKKVQDGPKTSITFGVEAEPPDLPCREEVLVEEGGTSPESCLPPSERRSPTTAGDLLPTGEVSTATRATSNEPLLRFYVTEEINPEEDSKKENL